MRGGDVEKSGEEFPYALVVNEVVGENSHRPAALLDFIQPAIDVAKNLAMRTAAAAAVPVHHIHMGVYELQPRSA